MPIFKVTVKEKAIRRAVAYVQADSKRVADAWAGMADDWYFREIEDGDQWSDSEVEAVDPVEAAPDGWNVKVI